MKSMDKTSRHSHSMLFSNVGKKRETTVVAGLSALQFQHQGTLVELARPVKAMAKR